jgi:DNA-binding beta-propeller fold protein YncE
VIAAVFLLLVVGVVGAADTQLSLQLKRQAEEVAPPDDLRADGSFARLDRTLGGFGLITGYFDRPVDVAVDSRENLFVLDAGNSRIQVFDSSGSFSSTFGTSGSGEGQFKAPDAVSIDVASNGEVLLYVVDTGNHRIQKFSANGRFLLQKGSLGTREGFFKEPRDLTFDQDHNIYVADTGNERIQKFDPTFGRVLDVWNRYNLRSADEGEFGAVVSVGFDDDRFGYILTLNSATGKIQRFELNGKYDRTTPLSPPGGGRFTRMEVDNFNDLIYVCDQEGNRVVRFNKEGVFQGEITEGDGSLKAPGGLAVDVRHRRLYVADTGNNRIEKFYLK